MTEQASAYHAAYLMLQQAGVVVQRDTFLDRVQVSAPCLGVDAAHLSDRTVGMLRHYLVETSHVDFGRENIFQALSQLAYQNERDSVRIYFDSLVSDGQKRLGDGWLLKQLGASDTKLNRYNLKRTLVAGVKRVYEPGAWVNFMLILSGPQRAGKTTFLRLMAREIDLFTDAPVLRLNAQQRQEALRGRHIVEIAELSGWRTTDVENTKAFKSTTHDSCRRSFDRLVTDQARRCILVGTTNEDAPLRDSTGNHRFPILPVGMKAPINLAVIEKNVDQIWAEAKDLYQSDFSLELPEVLWSVSVAASERQMEDDPWLDTLANLKGDLAEGEERVCYEQVFEHLSIPVERQSPMLARRVASLLVRIGWARRKKNYKWRRKTVRGFTRPLP